MSKELALIDAPELKGVGPSKAEQIRSTFEPMAEMLQGFEKDYNTLISEAKKEINLDVTSKAKRLRLDIARVRIETGKLKDKQKEQIKLEGRAIMGVHNILVWAVSQKENSLKEIENHFEIQEQKRLEGLQRKREEELGKYVEDAHERDLSGMVEDVWHAYLSTKKKQHEDRIEAERKAESDRIEAEKAEALERERIKKENEQLHKEKLAREKAAKIEADKRKKEELAREKAAKIEADKRKKEELARKAKEEAEREERAKIERKLKAKEEAEIEAKAQEEARIQSELSKGDKDKIIDLVADLERLKTKYTFKSATNKSKYKKVAGVIDDAIQVINS